MNKTEFKDIFESNYKDLLSYAYSITNSIHHSEEIVQDAFLSLWENRNRSTKINSIRSYLFKAVKYRALNLKSRYINKIDNFEYSESDEIALVDQTSTSDAVDLQNVIRQGIRQLPEQCRKIFLLSRFTSLTYAEIAELLDISVKTVETQMSIALKKMKQFLLKHGYVLCLVAMSKPIISVSCF